MIEQYRLSGYDDIVANQFTSSAGGMILSGTLVAANPYITSITILYSTTVVYSSAFRCKDLHIHN